MTNIIFDGYDFYGYKAISGEAGFFHGNNPSPLPTVESEVGEFVGWAYNGEVISEDDIWNIGEGSIVLTPVFAQTEKRIRFYVQNELYREILALSGDPMPMPETPAVPNNDFIGWQDSDSHAITEGEIVLKSADYFAQLRKRYSVILYPNGGIATTEAMLGGGE